MPLDLDPVYHTETMVKILRDQGSPQLAMELAELILQSQPEHAGVRAVLQELKEEARLAFERFKNSGRPAAAPSTETAEPSSEHFPESVPAAEVEGAAISFTPAVPRLTLISTPTPTATSRSLKIERLKNLLHRLENNQRSADAPPT